MKLYFCYSLCGVNIENTHFILISIEFATLIYSYD